MIHIKGEADRIGIWITGKSLGNIQWIYLQKLAGEKYGRAKLYQKGVNKREMITLLIKLLHSTYWQFLWLINYRIFKT